MKSLTNGHAQIGGDAGPVVLIAIDDTDNLDSRGTGFRARQLREVLETEGCGVVTDVTRHQLFVSPLIPYTSHNSAACIYLRCRGGSKANLPSTSKLHDICGDFLRRESAPGSDAGLCIAPLGAVSKAVRDFGVAAKHRVLTQDEAHALADREGLLLDGYTGTRDGVIGALAAVGLRAAGRDGRFLWLRGIRELVPGEYTLRELKALTAIDCFRPVDAPDEPIPDDGRIDIWWSIRPVMIDHKSTLLLEKQHEQKNHKWRSAPKELVRQY